MRKVVGYYVVSLDGVVEDPEEFVTQWEEGDAHLANAIATQDAVILGRRSYDEWAKFWPDSQIEPFASFINGVAKYVATSRPLDSDWSNTTKIEGDLIAFVLELKAKPGRDIGVHGSLSVVQALLAAGVVDELRLLIAPTIVSRERRLFDGLQATRFETLRCVKTPSGHLLVDYKVAP